MCKIVSVSSLSLRSMHGKEGRCLEEPISFHCSVCKKKYLLGKNAFVMVRVNFQIGKNEEHIVMCDVCVDRFTDIAVYGPRGARFEKVRSTFIRASVQQKQKFCFNCLNGNGSHILLKYEREKRGGGKKVSSKRLCAKCSISYLVTLSPEIEKTWR